MLNYLNKSFLRLLGMGEKLNINLPMDLIELTGLSTDIIQERSVLIWVLELYSEGKITLSKAAKLVNMNIDEFLSEFKRRHLRHVGGPNSLKEADSDYEVLQKLINEK